MRTSLGYQQSNQSRGLQEGGYYANRNSTYRPDSFIDQYTSPDVPAPGQGRGMRTNMRMSSEPMFPGGRGQRAVYPSHGYQQSYDTVNSSGSHQTDPYGNSTDPSSENSSLDRIHQLPKQNEQQQPVGDNHRFIGFGGNGQQYPLENYSTGQGGYGRSGYANASPSQPRYDAQERPPPPPKESPRAPIKLNSQGTSSPLTRQVSDSPTTDKRKSWFKRRFSKN